MRRLHTLPYVLLATLCLAVQLPTARAGISYTGDIDPADPADWDSSTDGYVGKTADGILTVDDGSDLLSKNCYIGYNSGVTGEVTITGTGSTWASSESIVPVITSYVGYFGNGTLNITSGAAVSHPSVLCIGYNAGSTGQVTVDGVGSTLTPYHSFASSVIHVGLFGSGTLNITNGGTVSNAFSYIGAIPARWEWRRSTA